MRTEYTTTIACPPERLWTFLEEPELQKQWMKGLLANEPTSGHRTVGSTFRLKIQEGRRVAEYDGEVTARDQPRHLGIRFWGGNMPKGMIMRVDYRLAAAADGTRLDYLAELESGSFPFMLKLLLPLIQLFSRWQLRRFMQTLKQLAEAPA